ncbi:centrosomal protein CEP57L1 isoform X2 [Vanacampus margaritifer]
MTSFLFVKRVRKVRKDYHFLVKLSDSPSKNSYIGSYYQPPNKMLAMPGEAQLAPKGAEPPVESPGPQPTKQNSQAVVDALRTLQDKIKRLEQERLQTEKSYPQLSHDARKHEPVATSTSLPVTEGNNRRELDSKLQSAESRCKVLERQLDYMRRMVDGARQDKDAPVDNQQEKQPSNPDNHVQREKLQKLESECLKLSRTQNLSEMKLAVLEQRLLKEEHERKLVQEKAGQLQRELDLSLRLSSSSPPAVQQPKPKKTPQKPIPKSPRPNGTASPRHQSIPFVAGMSTNPSHSVHANVQSILHMMKHHQPQLCERVSALHRTGFGARKSLRMDGQPVTARRDGEPEADAQSLSSLSDLLLALQDELGQMGFEHQELMRQIDATQHTEQRRELQRELESMVARMDKKGAQITKLRKHQQTVHMLTQQPRAINKLTKKQSAVQPLSTSPARPKSHHQERPSSAGQQSLHLLRETQKLRNSLKQEDICWEP